MIAAMLRRALVAALVVGLGIVAAPVWYRNWTFALVLEAATRDKDPETWLLEESFPGLPEAVRMLRNAVQPVYSLHRDQNPHVYQQLMEMAYPLRPTPYEPTMLKSGDLVVLDAGRELDVPSEQVFGRGQVRILRVR